MDHSACRISGTGGLSSGIMVIASWIATFFGYLAGSDARGMALTFSGMTGRWEEPDQY